MKLRPGIVSPLLCGLFIVTASVPAAKSLPVYRQSSLKRYNTKQFFAKVTQLVLRYYPKATVRITGEYGQNLHIEYKTRTFPLLDHSLKGNAYQESGPEAGGILCDISSEPGLAFALTDHTPILKKSRDRRYFTTHDLMVYSKKRDYHINSNLKAPNPLLQTTQKLQTEYNQLLEGFDKHLSDALIATKKRRPLLRPVPISMVYPQPAKF